MISVEDVRRAVFRERFLQRLNAERRLLNSNDNRGSGKVVRTQDDFRFLHLTIHDRQLQHAQPQDVHLLPRVHRVMSLLKRWLMGTHQGAISQ
ncbi:MAG: hypothetical protein WBE85_10400, partial [Methylocella sp.]